MEIKQYETYQKRVFCVCGWSIKASFGDRWYSDQQYPICPDCGKSKAVRELKTGRYVEEIIKKRKFWFDKTRWVWQDIK